MRGVVAHCEVFVRKCCSYVVRAYDATLIGDPSNVRKERPRIVIECSGLYPHTFNGENCAPCERDRKRTQSFWYRLKRLGESLVAFLCR